MTDLFEIAYSAEKLSSVLLTLRLALDSAEADLDKTQIVNILCLCQDMSDSIKDNLEAYEEQSGSKQ